jgi:hypothetical protein
LSAGRTTSSRLSVGYVEALGGELEVTATFGDKKIRLHGVWPGLMLT